MSLNVELRHRQGSFDLDVSFTSQGGVTALFGPSGCGKTSILRLIAGLDTPREGRITLDDEVLLDTRRNITVPTHRRRLGFVFQEPRLFPHLDVRQNLSYGQWFAGTKSQPSELYQITSLLGLDGLLQRRPNKLSGGEKQRVAIGRTLLSGPRLLLMDEPLSALDDARKAEILPYLEKLRDELNLPILYVSHSVTEVARLADHVVALEHGHITTRGSASEVLGGVGGSSWHEAGSVLTGRIELTERNDGLAQIVLNGCALLVPRASLTHGQLLRIHIPAREVLLATKKPEGISALNILCATIREITETPEGSADVVLQCGEETLRSRITILSKVRLGLRVGMDLYAVIKSVALAPAFSHR